MSHDAPDLSRQMTERLVRRLVSLERESRPPVAREIFLALDVSVVVDILGILVERRNDGDAMAGEALAAVTTCLSDLGDTDTASDLYAEARRRNRDDIGHLLMRPDPARRFNPREEMGIDREMRNISLGRRRQMARTADEVTRGRLATDPDPSVIRNLLRHPRTTEPDVIRVATRRPVRPEVLGEVYRSRRWSVRRGVRRALANNPYTPTEISLKLVSLLPLPDVRKIAQDGTLHEEVRRCAKERLVHAEHRQKVAKAAANFEDLEPEGDA